MTRDELYDALETAINHLYTYDLVELNNGWVEDNGYWDDWIYSWDELDEVFEDCTPSELFEIFRDCEERGNYFQKGDYSIRIGRLGNMDNLVNFEDLTNWVYQTMNGYGIEELEDIISEYLEQEEEEEDDE